MVRANPALNNCPMVYNVQRVKLRKMTSTTAICFMLVRRIKMMRVAILSGKIQEKTKILLNHFAL